jgi:hypothetical protein
MSVWQSITWDVARAGGFVAYGLVTISVVLGLILSLRWRTAAWPRWATNDLHRYITLLALVFIGIHTAAVWLDPFMAFGPGEIFVPLVSHYRPIWVALGIVTSYLMVAVWLSERVQRRIGYVWWRRFHYLTFGIYVLATIHGIGTGSDTRTGWAIGTYAGSVVLVALLLTVRLLGPAPHLTPRPRIAALAAVVVVAGSIWTVLGPLRPGWNAAANNGHGSGARIALGPGTGIAAANGARIMSPFRAGLNGRVTQSDSGGNATVQLDMLLNGGAQGTLDVTLQGQPDDAGALGIDRTNAVFSLPHAGETYRGRVTALNGSEMIIRCTGSRGDSLQLDVVFQVDGAGAVQGSVQGAPL